MGAEGSGQRGCLEFKAGGAAVLTWGSLAVYREMMSCRDPLSTAQPSFVPQIHSRRGAAVDSGCDAQQGESMLSRPSFVLNKEANKPKNLK